MKFITPTLAALSLSAASLSAAAITQDDLYGESAQSAQAEYMMTVADSARFVNVSHGDVVTFNAGGKEFTWKFNGLESKFELAKIAPADTATNGVHVYVTPQPWDHIDGDGD